MNGHKKWHQANGPAFAIGEKWKPCDGCSYECEITGVRKYGEGKWDYEVFYEYADGSTSKKNAWSFQVRYFHVADQNLKVKSKRAEDVTKPG